MFEACCASWRAEGALIKFLRPRISFDKFEMSEYWVCRSGLPRTLSAKLPARPELVEGPAPRNAG